MNLTFAPMLFLILFSQSMIQITKSWTWGCWKVRYILNTSWGYHEKSTIDLEKKFTMHKKQGWYLFGTTYSLIFFCKKSPLSKCEIIMEWLSICHWPIYYEFLTTEHLFNLFSLIIVLNYYIINILTSSCNSS